jgi:ubiquinone/menaquinone biosynthesis C-methylase UbiE
MTASVASALHPVGRGLAAANFRMIAPRGFGDGHNAYPHSMTWFRDHLFVTTTRDNLALVKMKAPFEIPLEHWPVRVPDDQFELDQRAQVWRFDPRTETWKCVFVSPTVRDKEGRDIPVSIGFRTMAVFQGEKDDAPALYLPSFAHGKLGKGSFIVRSPDGTNFEVLDEIKLADRDWVFRSFRALVPFKGRLFAAPTTGNVSGFPNTAGVAAVLVSSEPGRGGWVLANEINFGDPSNEGVFELGVFDGHLYAGTANIAQGYQLWKTDGEGEPPFTWTKILERGAYRGKLSQGPVKMCAFRDHLYLTTAIQNGGYDRANNVGPSGAEVVRVARDDSWDLIVGEPRKTPAGVIKAPLSGYGAGFGSVAAGYFWQLCEHDGWLYLSSFDSTILIAFQEPDEMSESVRAVLDPTTVDYLEKFGGGFGLWRSPDGVNWTSISINGFGNPFAYGIRTMISTEHGLFLGVTNPFGPDVAVKRLGGWRYEPNPKGGCEIWVGNPPATSRPEPQHVHDPLVATGGARHDDAICEALLRDFYEGSPLRTVGYWRNGATRPRGASEELIAEMLSWLPDREGRIADVGTTGETTDHLLRYYAPDAVVGVCADRAALRACSKRVRGTELVGDFHGFALDDASVEHAVCVERLPTDERRRVVLREVARVLKPGGRFVVAEMVRTEGGPPIALANGTDGFDVFRREFEAAGFRDVKVVDVTYDCWTRFYQEYSLYFGTRYLARQIDSTLFERLRDHLPGGGASLSHYLLISADKSKPEEAA